MTLKTMKKCSEIIKVIPHDPIPADFDNDYKLTLNPVTQNCCTQFNEGRLCTCSKRSNIGTRIIKEENYEMSDKLTLNPKPGHVLKQRRRATSRLQQEKINVVGIGIIREENVPEVTHGVDNNKNLSCNGDALIHVKELGIEGRRQRELLCLQTLVHSDFFLIRESINFTPLLLSLQSPSTSRWSVLPPPCSPLASTEWVPSPPAPWPPWDPELWMRALLWWS